MANGRVFVAAKDHHALYCLDAASGKKQWDFSTGGRIDSPPTLFEDKVYFGSCDGWVYCLRAADGQLAWKYRAAPEDYRIVIDDQLESAWPVHGSVLAVNDLIYGLAGRNTYLDGGLHLFALEPATGRVVHSARFDGPHVDVLKTIGGGWGMDGSRADILASDGDAIYLTFHAFDMSLVKMKTKVAFEGPFKVPGSPRLMPMNGYLDTDYFNRTHWAYGTQWPCRAGMGLKKLLVLSDTHMVTFQTRPKGGVVFDMGYSLQISGRTNAKKVQKKQIPAKKKDEESSGMTLDKLPVRVRGMVLAGNQILVAGTRGEKSDDPEKRLAALLNQGPAELWRINADSRQVIETFKLTAGPVFDGLIAAGARVFISLENGTVVCLGATAAEGNRR